MIINDPSFGVQKQSLSNDFNEFMQYGTVMNRGFATGLAIDIGVEYAAEKGGGALTNYASEALAPKGYGWAMKQHAAKSIANPTTAKVLAQRYNINRFIGGMKPQDALKASQGRMAGLTTRMTALKEYGAKFLGKSTNKRVTHGIAAAGLAGGAMKTVGAVFTAGMVQDLTEAAMTIGGAIDPGGMFEDIGRASSIGGDAQHNVVKMASTFIDNRHAATMRQKSLSAIHNTQMNLNQVFGAEATYAHQ